MRLIYKIAKWLRQKYAEFTAQRYQAWAVGDYPKGIKEGIVYIVSDGPEPDTLIFKCPCGCHSDIYLNLLADASPRWQFSLEDRSRITVRPSVWRKTGCRSHFFIRRGRIDWCG